REAVRALRRIARTDRARRGRAEYLAAWLLLRVGDGREGEAAMRRVLGGRRATPRQRRAATWELGLRAFLGRRFGDAATFFRRYAALGEGPMVAGRGAYWRGRAEAARGRRGAALAAYRTAQAQGPLHWYGQLARLRQAELGSATELGLRPAPPAPPPLPAPALPAAAAFYRDAGFPAEAARALTRRESALRDAAPRGRVAETVVRARLEAGHTSGAYRLAARQDALLAMEPAGAARWAWEAAYPRPEEALVREVAARLGIPWEHLYATMRQESAFDARATSRADARGLLQLLPRVAARDARRLGLPEDPGALYDARVNVRLGAQEIARLQRRFSGSLPLMAAAYNAGAARTERWLRELGGEGELDLFVERIPFDETRGYVRRVLSHVARYRYLDGGDDTPAMSPTLEGVGAPPRREVE
ncbi:MAG: lytic transglycosylase domain-containing protein, partial [Myxococcota bacterium]